MTAGVTVADTVPTSIRPSVQGLVARLLPAYPHVRRVHVSSKQKKALGRVSPEGQSVVMRKLVAGGGFEPPTFGL